MLLDVESFRQRVDYELDSLVSDLQTETRRSTPAEATAWRNSLPAFARVLSDNRLKGFHVHIGHKGDLMVEYKLPASACWADLVLLGSDNDGASAVIVELKDWNTTCDCAGVREGLVRHADREQSHLSADERIDGNVVLTTTSSAQNSNWQALFKNSAGHRAAHMTLGNRYNIVRACTHWQPAVTWIWRFR